MLEGVNSPVIDRTAGSQVFRFTRSIFWRNGTYEYSKCSGGLFFRQDWFWGAFQLLIGLACLHFCCANPYLFFYKKFSKIVSKVHRRPIFDPVHGVACMGACIMACTMQLLAWSMHAAVYFLQPYFRHGRQQVQL